MFAIADQIVGMIEYLFKEKNSVEFGIERYKGLKNKFLKNWDGK